MGSASFETNLTLSLKLESDGKESTILSGNIERISLSLFSYGHTCNIQFSGHDNDEVDQILQLPKVIKATISFMPNNPLDGTDPLLELKGIVTHKCFTRLPSEKGREKKPVRHYEIYFSDNLKTTWQQHYPINIYVDESMKDIIDKHKNPEISLEYKWDNLETKHPITAFSLDYKDWLPEYQQVSFYSFLIWYLRKEDGILSYDYKSNTHTIAGKKKEAAGKPLTVYEWLVYPPLCLFPNIPRHDQKIIKHSVDNLDSEDKKGEEAFKNVKRETITEDNYHYFPEQAHEHVKAKLTPEKSELEVEFIEFSGDLQIDKLVPDSFICFKGDGEGNWSSDACFKDKNFRVRNLHFEANKLDISEELIKPLQTYQLYVKAKLEEDDETFVEWPKFNPPQFPFHIQGKIFSDIGDKEQSTYKILESEKSPQGQYLVAVPLVSDGKKVVAPFVPAFSGQHYYPLCKDARVMLSMYFRTSKIDRPIDWDPLARLPMGIQGHRNVWASNGKDKYVVSHHEFVNGTESVFTVKQSSSDTQTQTIEIKEKNIAITVDDKGKKTLFVHLDQDSALTVSLEDKDAGVTQQLILDGKSTTSIFTGSSGTSTYIQDADNITIDCKNFTVNSEKITLNAKDAISLKGANKIDNETKVFNAAASAVKLG